MSKAGCRPARDNAESQRNPRTMSRRYTVILVPGSRPGRYVTHVPAIPGCTTQGDSIEDAIAMARDAASGMLALAIGQDEEVPIEPRGTLVTSIEVEAIGMEAARTAEAVA